MNGLIHLRISRDHLSSESACVAGWYVGLMWTPKYLVDVVGVSIEASGFVLLLPYILPAAGTLVGGCERSSRACADLTARCMRVNRNTPDLNTILCAPARFLQDTRDFCVAGWCDSLISKGWKISRARKLMEVISIGSSILSLGYFVVEAKPSVFMFTVLNCVNGFFGAFAVAGCVPPSPLLTLAAQARHTLVLLSCLQALLG